MLQDMVTAVAVKGEQHRGFDKILTAEALQFVATLEREFRERRATVLAEREKRQAELLAGKLPTLLEETDVVRYSAWQVAPAPADLDKRHVEITGPVERKMMINALNSGADVFMADFEDSLSPTWFNVVQGQINCADAVRRELRFYDERKGKVYALDREIATLVIRPRGWHLVEKHVEVDGAPVSASIFDFGLYMFHNAKALVEQGSGPYFYLAKLEGHLEARLWNELFNRAQALLGIPQGTIRATVLIETILAAYEMEEILYELRQHAAGLNAGRWDYIFSVIKKFHHRAEFVLPDRGQVTMTTPFMRAYTQRMVHVCHKRGAHAIGGMAAFIPSRRDEMVNKRAFTKVRADKVRELADGCDGTWVAHPDLVPLVRDLFVTELGNVPHQKRRIGSATVLPAEQLLAVDLTPGEVTEAGVRLNIRVALQYIDYWLAGQGAVAINNLMEDAATAEISRSQLWQWLHHSVTLADGETFTKALYEQWRDEEVAALGGEEGRLTTAIDILNQLVLADEFIDFLTLVAYPLL